MTTVQICDGARSVLKEFEHLNSESTIVLGVGNISRGDDGLGWAFLKEIESWEEFQGVIEYRYLLLVEDASLIADYENVIFVDAFHGKVEGVFSFEPVEPGKEFEFSTHIIPPRSILYLTQELYNKSPGAYTLAIEGSQWGLGKKMSPDARRNLDKAVAYFKEVIAR